MNGAEEALKSVLDAAPPELCAPLAEALGVSCGGSGGTPSAEECEGCAAAMAAALEGRKAARVGLLPDAAGRGELARVVGWLQGFASTVWLLPMARKGGVPLVDGEICAEYEKNVNRLAELAGLGEEA